MYIYVYIYIYIIYIEAMDLDIPTDFYSDTGLIIGNLDIID